MRKLILLGAAISLITACNSPAPAEGETAQETPVLEVYGDSNMTPDNAIESSQLIAMMEGHDSLKVKVSGTINECCQKKGCWMDVDLGNGQSMTVRFKDYGFFVPMDAAGRTAIMEGVATLDTMDVDWLRHKAQDAGKSEAEIAAITEPEVSVSFLASGVILK